MPLTVKEELCKATGTKYKKGGDTQASLAELARKIGKLNDDGWEKLSEPAQEWANAANTAISAAKEIPGFSGPQAAEREEDDGEEMKASKKPAAKPAGKKEAKPAAKPVKESKPAGKKEVKPAAKKESKPASKEKTPAKAVKSADKTPSMRRTLKQMVVKNPKLSASDLTEKLKAKGHKASDLTISSIRSDTRDTMRVLIDAGMLKGVEL